LRYWASLRSTSSVDFSLHYLYRGWCLCGVRSYTLKYVYWRQTIYQVLIIWIEMVECSVYSVLAMFQRTPITNWIVFLYPEIVWEDELCIKSINLYPGIFSIAVAMFKNKVLISNNWKAIYSGHLYSISKNQGQIWNRSVSTRTHYNSARHVEHWSINNSITYIVKKLKTK